MAGQRLLPQIEVQTSVRDCPSSSYKAQQTLTIIFSQNLSIPPRQRGDSMSLSPTPATADTAKAYLTVQSPSSPLSHYDGATLHSRSGSFRSNDSTRRLSSVSSTTIAERPNLELEPPELAL